MSLVKCSNINAKQAIAAIKASLITSDEVLAKYIIAKTGKSAKYTYDITLLVEDIKLHMGKITSYYENQPQAISAWCATVKPLLTTYKAQMTGSNSTAKEALVTAFDQGENTVYGAQNNLLSSSGIAVETNDELVALKFKIDQLSSNPAIKQFTPEIDQKIEAIRNALKQLLCVEGDIKAETDALRSAYGQARIYMWVDDDLEDKTMANQSIDNLIAKCNEFSAKPY